MPHKSEIVVYLMLHKKKKKKGSDDLNFIFDIAKASIRRYWQQGSLEWKKLLNKQSSVLSGAAK